MRQRVRAAQGGAHESVMVAEVLSLLAPKNNDVVLDATAGSGGHSQALLGTENIRLVALDEDPAAVLRTRARLASFGARASVLQSNFKDAAEALRSIDIKKINKALFDLGWSREQLSSGRGFSFLRDEPLSMSYGAEPSSGFSAADILNTWSGRALADVFFGYGQERYARRIARAVVEVRKRTPFERTGQLVECIAAAVPASYRHGRTHFATKTFQALRVAANDEYGAIRKGLPAIWHMLSAGGRMAIITFHSGEDRIVKHLLREFVQKKEGLLLTKKPLVPSKEETLRNPSARSAKLRGIEKIESEIRFA